MRVEETEATAEEEGYYSEAGTPAERLPGIEREGNKVPSSSAALAVRAPAASDPAESFMMLRLLYRRFYSSSHLGSRKVLQFFPFLIELPHGSGQAILFYPRLLA